LFLKQQNCSGNTGETKAEQQESDFTRDRSSVAGHGRKSAKNIFAPISTAAADYLPGAFDFLSRPVRLRQTGLKQRVAAL
jgi:hypothetical protein